MRTLLLLRHAKSASDDATLADFERPLAPEGVRMAPIIGEFLINTIGLPDLVLCSAATRARQTWEQVSHGYEQDIAVQISRDLYLASAESLCDAIKSTPDNVQRLLIVAHNPGMHQLARHLTGSGNAQSRARLADRFPTGAIAEIALNVDKWPEVTPAIGEIRRFITPKELSAD
ncbi:MAG: SixA phosphatase family protein [Alphaproteobacteria bacterium]